MANKSKFQAIKGTRDLLPPETALWNHVEQTAHEVFRTFGFGEIRVPIFEPTELFARSIGEDTDVVGKEMYTFSDRPAPTEGEANGSESSLATRHSPLRSAFAPKPQPPSAAPTSSTPCSNSLNP